MRISKKAEYGLRAMVYLAKNAAPKNPCSLKEISQEEEIPFDFLEKIMAELEKAKLVKAKKGVKGGYFLIKNPQKITVADIFIILGDVSVLVGCVGCPRSRLCSTKEVWQEAQQSLDSAFSVTLANLIKPKKHAKKK